MDDDPQAELRAIQSRARKKAVRRMLVMGPAILTMLIAWGGATLVVGWLVGAFAGGVLGALVAVGLEKVLPRVEGDDEI
ncbi:MAG: hypothetical protein IT378_25625 [Sandaracinaceae bacterium]|nr:hypothetical protein [Sandaracinaceae bacterium]MCC6877715.1 hypothetical protein [Sandaracinaceae bacterium]